MLRSVTVQSSEWLEATKETRGVCEAALAVPKTHISRAWVWIGENR